MVSSLESGALLPTASEAIGFEEPIAPCDETLLAVLVLQGLRPRMDLLLKIGVDPKIGEVLTQCWEEEPTKRPTMDQVLEQLATLIKAT